MYVTIELQTMRLQLVVTCAHLSITCGPIIGTRLRVRYLPSFMRFLPYTVKVYNIHTQYKGHHLKEDRHMKHHHIRHHHKGQALLHSIYL